MSLSQLRLKTVEYLLVDLTRAAQDPCEEKHSAPLRDRQRGLTWGETRCLPKSSATECRRLVKGIPAALFVALRSALRRADSKLA